jgi:hypothetical protein
MRLHAETRPGSHRVAASVDVLDDSQPYNLDITALAGDQPIASMFVVEAQSPHLEVTLIFRREPPSGVVLRVRADLYDGEQLLDSATAGVTASESPEMGAGGEPPQLLDESNL